MKNLFCALIVLLASSAWAAKDPFATSPAYVGALGGVSVPDAQNTSERSVLGVAAGAKLSDEFGVGAFYLTSAKGERYSNGNEFEFRYATYGLEANYLFDGTAAGAHVGARVGLARVSKDPVGQTYSYNPFFYGLQAGYDYMLGEHFSLGAEANVMFFREGTMDNTTGLVVGAFDVLNLMVAAKFWF